ncbi:MAG: fibro-slime domain-containing protein [Phycisphaerales bacterium JB039]
MNRHLTLTAIVGLAVASPAVAQQSDPPEPPPPEVVTVYGVVRDFRPYNEPGGGHDDFEQYNTGHRVGWVALELDDEGKPALAGGQGKRVNTQAKDAEDKNIFPRIAEADYMDARPGDSAPSLESRSDPVVTSDETFYQWFRNVPGVNLARLVPLELRLNEQTGQYVFHAHDDYSTSEREGFFPIDGQLYGNPAADQWGHNYHFTMELATKFVYKEGTGQVFTFFGDDDVWVFIDGKMVIDLGGVHGAVSQTVELDRLNWLEDGEKYELKLFFAERHFTRSNCRIETNLLLKVANIPAVDALHD